MRRQLCLAGDLKTISVPLDARSTALMESACASASLASNNAFGVVTLVEGLRTQLQESHMRALSAALASAPTFIVRDATLVECKRDSNFTLVILELEPAAAVAIQERTLALTAGCMLSQWKLHIGLGLAPKLLAARAARTMISAYSGTVLTVDAGPLHSFSPIAEENAFPETKRLGSPAECNQQSPASMQAAIPKPVSTSNVGICPGEQRYVLHRRELMVLVCADFGRRIQIESSLPLYNQKRRQLRISETLETISVHLTATSTTFIHPVRAFASLASITATAHVTLVEGLRAPIPKMRMRGLSAALARAPTLMIRDARLEACKRNKNCALVVFELVPVATVAERARALANHVGCVLPQWLLHVSLGVAPKEQAALAARELLAAHGGTSLAVDAGRLVALSPRTAQFPSRCGNARNGNTLRFEERSQS